MILCCQRQVLIKEQPLQQTGFLSTFKHSLGRWPRKNHTVLLQQAHENLLSTDVTSFYLLKISEITYSSTSTMAKLKGMKVQFCGHSLSISYFLIVTKNKNRSVSFSQSSIKGDKSLPGKSSLHYDKFKIYIFC